MNLLIDPGLFAPSVGGEEELNNCLAESIRILGRSGVVVNSDEDWADIYKTFISPAFAAAEDQRTKVALSILRKRHSPPKVATAVSPAVRTWGILPLMGIFKTEATLRSNLLAKSAYFALLARLDFCLFSRPMESRNIQTHQVGHSKLIEKTRWRIYLGGIGLRGASAVPCVFSARNVAVPWTARYDEFLPDSGVVPFVPPATWWKRDAVAYRTVASKLAWIDVAGNGWVSPNTPGCPHHWDVHFVRDVDSPNGLNPANIVRWGAPASQGTCGSVHHVPSGKASRAQ